ncbi:MAG TPA: ECF-type sigma factor [Terracidiphilus sp.]|nr:ECF-type sigma factor [Terracidiphilus sp.]
MPSEGQGEVTQLLERWHAGDRAAFDALVPVVYRDLRALARSMMRRERSDHTLQPTALLNETFLRLAREQKVAWADRSHFFAFAARLMRNILTDHARARLAGRRGGPNQVRLELREDLAWIGCGDAQMLDLHRALERLEKLDARKVRIVELRYFFAFTTAEAAEALNLSLAAAERDLQFARGWLYRELRGDGSPHEP